MAVSDDSLANGLIIGTLRGRWHLLTSLVVAQPRTRPSDDVRLDHARAPMMSTWSRRLPWLMLGSVGQKGRTIMPMAHCGGLGWPS